MQPDGFKNAAYNKLHAFRYPSYETDTEEKCRTICLHLVQRTIILREETNGTGNSSYVRRWRRSDFIHVRSRLGCAGSCHRWQSERCRRRSDSWVFCASRQQLENSSSVQGVYWGFDRWSKNAAIFHRPWQLPPLPICDAASWSGSVPSRVQMKKSTENLCGKPVTAHNHHTVVTQAKPRTCIPLRGIRVQRVQYLCYVD